jgi:hypothetical protein
MRRSFYFPAFLLAVLLVSSFLGPPLGLSHELAPGPAPAPAPASSFTLDPAIMDFAKVFGFGVMIFLIWWGDNRKIDKLTTLINNYETLTKNYEGIVKELRDTMLLTMQINTRVVEKLEYLLRTRGGEGA